MSMKLIRILSVVIFVTSQLSARALENQFIRKPGGYSLDSKGSTLTITQTASNAWRLKVTWKSKDTESSDQSSDYLKAAGWFVFVETSERIWIFDGVNSGLTHQNDEIFCGEKRGGEQTEYPHQNQQCDKGAQPKQEYSDGKPGNAG